MALPRPYAFCGALIAAFTLLRLAFVLAAPLDLAPDEAQYWDWSRTLQLSYYSKPPLIAWWIALWTSWLGDTVLGVRAGAVAGSVLLQGVWWWWAARVWRRPEAAPWVLLVLNTTVFLSAGAVLMTTDNLLLLWWSAALAFFHLVLRENRGWAPLAVALALGVLAKYTMLAFVPVALVAAWRWGRRWPLPPGFWARLGLALGLGAVVGGAPLIVWNLDHDWVGVKHVLYRGSIVGATATRLLRFDSPIEFVASQIALLTPWWAFFLLQGLRRSAALDPEVALLGRTFFWPVFGAFGLWSFHTKIEANWAVTAYAGGLMLVAETFRHVAATHPRSRRWIVGASLGVALAVYLQAVVPLPGPLLGRLVGWREMGEAVGRQMQALPGPTFAFAEEYGVTAELSFYTPGQQRAYCIDTGRKRNQYDLWPAPGPGFQDAVFVQRGRKAMPPPQVQALFRHIEPPIFLETSRRGIRGQTFTLFVCRGYCGRWPHTEAKKY